MTVGKLIELLSELDGEAEVRMCYDSEISEDWNSIEHIVTVNSVFGNKNDSGYNIVYFLT